VSQGFPESEATATEFETDDCGLLPIVLEKLAEQEARLAERFYEVFFALRPDSVPLFGVHSISEREEMIAETLRSLYAWAEGEPWLGDNLDALGRSHFEYGVTGDMYPSFVDAMLECVRELLGTFLDAEKTHDLRIALEAVCKRMRLAGDEAERSA